MQMKLYFLSLTFISIVYCTNSYAQVIEGFKNSSTTIVKTACEKALNANKLDDESFVKTECGMYMLGYAHGAYSMSNVLIDGTGYNEGSWRVVKNKPYCDREFMKLSDLAKLFMDEANSRVENSETVSILINALHKKYPCDQYKKEQSKIFEENGYKPPVEEDD
jgi:hypothetical protein